MKKLSLITATLLLPFALNAKMIPNQQIEITPSPNVSPIVIPDILKPTDIKEDAQQSPFIRTGPTVQLAILLDTSGSMNGLINQTRSQIWKIINEISKANKDNKGITLQVALYEYGKSTISKYEGFSKMLVPLTNDLDLLSEKLFSLNTNGGEEYSGMTIKKAVDDLQWSNHKDDLKLIIIAGNESFEQGNIPYSYAINKAKNKNIIVNTIFCGNNNNGINLKWSDGAKLGGGKYMNIEQDRQIVYVKTPYDTQIQNLNIQLNNTYISYGSKGMLKKSKQLEQDKASKEINEEVAIERSIAKASANYQADSWDIVSFSNSGNQVADEMLSESKSEIFNDKDLNERKEIVKKAKNDREKITKEINELRKKREAYINKEKKNKDDKTDLGSVLIKNIKDVLKKNEFEIQ